MLSADGDTFIVVGKPSMLSLVALERLNFSTAIYDCMDDFPSFYHGLSRRCMKGVEKELVRNVDKVLVSSTELMRRWRGCALNIELVRNAFDIVATPEFRPRPPAKKNGLIYGYLGTVGDWFDWEWVIRLALLRTNDCIRIIGPIFNPPQVSLPKNIEIRPPLPHAKAMTALQQFDVGIIPFRNTSLSEAVDPIKYYEYRALGLPVLSSYFGEMIFRASDPGVFLCDSSNIDACAALTADYLPKKEEILSFRKKHNWHSRFDVAGIL